MRGLIQRVTEARVEVDGEVVGAIGRGLLLFVGVALEDAEADAAWLAAKSADLRIFEDEAGKMSSSVTDVKGGVLVVSQFTLYGDARKGRRPSFSAAARPEQACRSSSCQKMSPAPPLCRVKSIQRSAKLSQWWQYK